MNLNVNGFCEEREEPKKAIIDSFSLLQKYYWVYYFSANGKLNFSTSLAEGTQLHNYHRKVINLEMIFP